MENFKKLGLLEKRKLAIRELVIYYAELRKYNYKNGEELKGVELRKKIHFLVDFILKIDQLISKERIIIVNDRHTNNSENSKIFACTHIGGNDIQRTFQVIKEPAYLMLGDPGILYRMPIYQGLKLNGVIPLETTDREDRKIAYQKSLELLQKGGNLLIYPEGAWNVTPNSIVMKIFTGTVRLAKETGSEIIPIGVEQYDNVFYFNIGENYSIPFDSQKSISYYNDQLREKLATLKWEIMEMMPTLERKDVTENYLRCFQDEIVNRCNYGYGFSLEDAINESFHDKSIINEDEVFAFLEKLEINPNNCFLAKDKHNFILKKKK